MTAKLEFAQYDPVVADKQGVLHGKLASGTRLDSGENWQKYEYRYRYRIKEGYSAVSNSASFIQFCNGSDN